MQAPALVSGHAVALHDHHPGGVEPGGHVERERGAAGDEEADPAAEPLSDLGQDQPVGQGVLGAGDQAHSATGDAGQATRSPTQGPAAERGLHAAFLLETLHHLACTFSKIRGGPAMNVGRTSRQVGHDPVHPAVDGRREPTCVPPPAASCRTSATAAATGTAGRPRSGCPGPRQRHRCRSSTGAGARRPWAGRWYRRCRSRSRGPRDVRRPRPARRRRGARRGVALRARAGRRAQHPVAVGVPQRDDPVQPGQARALAAQPSRPGRRPRRTRPVSRCRAG